MRFRQTFINSAERALIGEMMAFLLSLLPHKIEEKKYDFSVTVGPTRLIQESSKIEDSSSLLTLTVLAEPLNEVYPSPYVISFNFCLISRTLPF